MVAVDVGTIASVATALAVVVALVFGVLQVRLQSGQRRDLAQAEMLRGMLTPQFLAAVDLIQNVADDAPVEVFLHDAELRRAFYLLDFNFEAVGWMVHEGVLPLHSVDALFGGIVRLAWRKGRRFVEHDRASTGAPSRGEWTQWLYERMEEDPAPGKREGAHVAFREWRR